MTINGETLWIFTAKLWLLLAEICYAELELRDGN